MALINRDEMVSTQARIFDDLRPPDAKLFLLKHAGQTKRMSVVAEITSGWYSIFDKEFRDEMKVSIATLSDIGDQVAQSSFLAYGVGDAGDEIDVFSFDKKDTFKPNATSPSWKIHSKRESQERFTIPD